MGGRPRANPARGNAGIKVAGRKSGPATGPQAGQVCRAARASITHLLGRPAHLKLFVRVTEGWSRSARDLRELGYGA